MTKADFETRIRFTKLALELTDRLVKATDRLIQELKKSTNPPRDTARRGKAKAKTKA